MIRIERIRVTPAIAAKWLAENNTANRPLNRSRVDHLAHQMSLGKWVENGDTIGFSGSTLVDGQHRLAAIVRSGVSLDMIIVRGLPEEAFQTKDIGAKRSGSDILAICGEKNATNLAAAIRFVRWFLQRDGLGDASKITNQCLVETLGQHPGIRDSVRFMSGIKMETILRSSVAAGCHYLFSVKDRELADWFFSRLKDGLEINTSNPVYLLRQRLIIDRSNKGFLRPEYVAAYVVKAWNYTRKKQKLGVLKMAANESFPTIE